MRGEDSEVDPGNCLTNLLQPDSLAPMTFQEAKERKIHLESACCVADIALKSIDGVGTGAMGLTPDSVRNSPEYKAAREAFSQSFARLRAFNAFFVKAFKTELKEERNTKRA